MYYGLAADMAAYTGVLLGDKYFQTDTGVVYTWNGTAWVEFSLSQYFPAKNRK